MSETRTAFYRFRHKSAASLGDWEYREYGELGVGEDIPEWFFDEEAHELMAGHNSDMYRGVDLEQVEKPPIEWLQGQVRQSTKAVTYHTKRAERLSALIAQREAEELAQWEAGTMVEWCTAHDRPLAECPQGSRKCQGQLRTKT